MWPWNRERREPVGEPPPEIGVFPSEVRPGEEVQFFLVAPAGGIMEVEFILEAAAVEEAAPVVVTPAPTVPVAPAPPVMSPLPGNPTGPSGTPLIRAPTVSAATATTDQMPQLADQIANVIAYALVFYGMVAASMAANFKFGWLVTIALWGIVWYLRDIIIFPLQGLVRSIIMVVFHVLIEIVDFVWQWLVGVVHFFGGDLVRAVLQTLMVAAFLWVWEEASQIPVIGQLFTWIEQTASQVLTWVQTQIQVLSTFVDGVRRSLEADIADVTKGLGNLGDELRGLIDTQLEALFGRVRTSITGLRAEVLGQLSFVVAAVNLQTGIFAAALHLSPETARRYLQAYARHNPHETVANAAGLVGSTARGALGTTDFSRTPWGTVDELRADLVGIRRGVAHDAHTWALELMDDLRTLHRGDTPDVPPFAQDVIDKLLTPTDDPGPLPDLPPVEAPDIPPVEAVG